MIYATVNLEGGFFPADLLDRIAAGDADLPGLRASDFGLGDRRLTDELQDAYSYAQTEWKAFQRRYQRAKDTGQSVTTATREGWINPLLERLDYLRHGYVLVRQPAAVEAGNERFLISHRAGEDPTAPPVHIVGFDGELDRRGEHRRSPHASVQEYLNRSDSLWGIVTNGRTIRLLRRNERLAKSAYIEFDLAGMMESNVYSEFALLYLVLHRTRLPKSAGDAPDCILEQWYQRGIDEGGRVRERLRDGVEAALKRLGNALLKHERSDALREEIASGRLSPAAYYRELLRLIYRLLFLMVAEERRLMFPETRENEARRAIFSEHYGIGRLRDRADRYVAEDAEIDLWERLKHSFVILRDDRIARMLGIAALNGELFGPRVCEHIESASCRNDELLRAIHSLSTFVDGGVRRRVNYSGLDVEELGSVYESLLDYHPEVSAAPAHFDLVVGSERRATGSYYTPPELVGELIKSALEPVVAKRLAGAKTKEEKKAALLSLRVIDPACGSGHFLLAAVRGLGRELAKIESEEEEPPRDAYRRAVRAVIRECIYAVDKNPLAVDLCKVALWIEGLNAGQPLNFLDAHVRCGDSLLGVFDLRALHEGVPDDAYNPVTGDDKEAAREFKRRNRGQRKDPPSLRFYKPPSELVEKFAALALRDEATPDEVAAKEREYERLRRDDAWWKLKNACDLWGAAFFDEIELPEFRGRELVPTTDNIWNYLNSPKSVYAPMLAQANALSAREGFFHWPLEFPDVLSRGGFDVVLGNPPWGQKGVDKDERRRKFILSTLRSTKGIFDHFRGFVELSARLVRPNGTFGLALPDVLLLKDYEETRELLLRNTTITLIHWWGQVFSSATIDAITLVAVKNEAAVAHKISVIIRSENREVRHDVPQSDFDNNPRKVFNLHLVPGKRRLLERIARASRPLADLFEVHEGVHSGNIRRELFVPSRVDDTCEKLVVSGAEMKPFVVSWRGDFIRLAAVPTTRTRERYANVGRIEWHRRPKVVVRRTGDSVLAAVDMEGLFFSNNFFLVLPKPECPLDLVSLCALLNTRFMTWYFRCIEPRAGRVFAELKIKHINAFPIPKLLLDQPARNGFELFAQHRAELATAHAHEQGCEPKLSGLDEQLEEIVCQLLGLTAHELSAGEGN
jgi:hypothetical protein